MPLTPTILPLIVSAVLASGMVVQTEEPSGTELPSATPPADPTPPVEPAEPEVPLLAEAGQRAFSPEDADVLRLYRAFLNREPDGEGARYWLEIRTDATLAQIAQQFASSPEFARTYGELDDEEFLTVAYSNVLGRPADPAGFVYWLGLVQEGLSRVQAVQWITASDEFRAAHPYERLSLADAVSLGLEESPDDGQPSTSQATYAVLGAVEVRMCDGQPVTVDLNRGQMPTEGDDVILGTVDSDVIFALGGNDSICSSDGNDLVVGGDGDDRIFSGAGSDRVFGSAGADLLYGERGNDELIGGADADTGRGGDGDDQLFGSAGSDYLLGEEGDDVIAGGPGDESMTDGAFTTPAAAGIYGGDGDDQLFGEGGVDAVFGGDGNDVVAGGDGDDLRLGRFGVVSGLYGGPGADDIFGGAGSDALFGDAGPDRLSGGDGNDFAWGGDFDDVLYGGPGDDEMSFVMAGAGTTASLERGDDTFFGGAGDDTINGMEGRDTIFGGPGNDDLAGGSDDDRLEGGGGTDTLTGDFVAVIAQDTGADFLNLAGTQDVCIASPSSAISDDCEEINQVPLP